MSHLEQVYPAITMKNNITIKKLQHGTEVLSSFLKFLLEEPQQAGGLLAFEDSWAKYHVFVLGKISGSSLFTSDEYIYVCIASTS